MYRLNRKNAKATSEYSHTFYTNVEYIDDENVPRLKPIPQLIHQDFRSKLTSLDGKIHLWTKSLEPEAIAWVNMLMAYDSIFTDHALWNYTILSDLFKQLDTREFLNSKCKLRIKASAIVKFTKYISIHGTNDKLQMTYNITNKEVESYNRTHILFDSIDFPLLILVSVGDYKYLICTFNEDVITYIDDVWIMSWQDNSLPWRRQTKNELKWFYKNNKFEFFIDEELQTSGFEIHQFLHLGPNNFSLEKL
jgi:hypothetical protein